MTFTEARSRTVSARTGLLAGIGTAIGLERATCTCMPHVHRVARAKRLVRPSVIVEAEPVGNPGARLTGIRVALQIHVLVLQRSPKQFDEHIVDPAIANVHRYLDA